MTDTTQPPAETLAIESAAQYVLKNSRRGSASLNREQFAADTDKLVAAYRDIIGKAVASGHLASLTRRAGGDAMPAGEVDWREIARLAGEHGLRYRTNRALLQFLDAVPYTPKPPAGGDAEAVERNIEAQRQTIEACARLADRMGGGLNIAGAIRRLAPNAALALPAPVVEGEPFLAQLRRVNTDRYQAWVGDGEDGGLLFDATELGGEVGELLNVVKKLDREQRGWRGSRAGPDDFADECADVLICLDKLARRGGVDLEAATIRKFNATSEKHNFPHRLSEGRSHG